jgi:hypothetical protein
MVTLFCSIFRAELDATKPVPSKKASMGLFKKFAPRVFSSMRDVSIICILLLDAENECSASIGKSLPPA